SWRCSRNDESLDVMAGTSTWRVRARRIDLAHALEQIDATDCDGVTTTAFLDLVSAAWLDRLGAWLARSKLPLLATLSVDGRRLWRPALPADAHLLAAFQRHQTGDKGFGPALGGTAVDALAQRLAAQAYDVKTIRSDWQVGAADRDLLQQMVAESAAVATETEPAHAADFAAWSATRSAQIAAGALALAVGHLDLLAVPTR
ncbi:MAG: hypothetical protein ACREUW_20805, partial [Burkholderiales bacterium]